MAAHGSDVGGAAAVQQGLWGHAGLKEAPSRTRIMALVACVMAGYAVALLINGAASKLLVPRFAVPPTGDPLQGIGLAVLAADPCFLLSAFRFVAAGGLLLIMAARNDVPWAAGAAPAAALSLTDPATLKPLGIAFVIGCCNAGGYLFYMCLTARGGVALYSALAGTYVVLPVAYGILRHGEGRSPKKLAGVAVCVVAGCLLGVGERQESSGSAGTELSSFLLFALCIGSWGACDGLAAFIGRQLHGFYVAAMTMAGFGMWALVCASLSYFVVAANPPSEAPAATTAGGGSAASGYAAMFLGQVLGVAAWYSSVLLGKLSEASSFLPITSLYTTVTSLLAVAFLGESLPPAGWAGIALAAVGMLLIATSAAPAPAPAAAVPVDSEAGGDTGKGEAAAAGATSIQILHGFIEVDEFDEVRPTTSLAAAADCSGSTDARQLPAQATTREPAPGHVISAAADW